MKITGQAAELEPWDGFLQSDIYATIREAAPGWDVYYLEQEWRTWVGCEEIQPKYPEKHFLKFAQSWFEKRGPPQ
jgi:hypothetical protein